MVIAKTPMISPGVCVKVIAQMMAIREAKSAAEATSKDVKAAQQLNRQQQIQNSGQIQKTQMEEMEAAAEQQV